MAPPFALIPSENAVAETVRLLCEWRDEAVELPRGRRAPTAEEIDSARRGGFPGFVFPGPKGDAIGLVALEGRSARGARVALYLEKGYRRPSVVGAVVGSLNAQATPPAVRLDLRPLGISGRSLAGILEPEGWRQYARLEMRFPSEAPLPPAPPLAGLRPLDPADAPLVVALLSAAFVDFPLDLAYFALGQEGEEEPARGVADLFGGVYGPFQPGASFGLEREGGLAAVVMVTEFDGPLVAEVAVAPAFRGRGWARALLGHALAAIRRGFPDTPPRLAVTEANHPARRLYESVGFHVANVPENNVWVDFTRAGRPELARALARLAPSVEQGPAPESRPP